MLLPINEKLEVAVRGWGMTALRAKGAAMKKKPDEILDDVDDDLTAEYPLASIKRFLWL